MTVQPRPPRPIQDPALIRHGLRSLDLVASGEASTVFRAERDGAPVAVKVYARSAIGDAVSAARLARERDAQRAVSHPCVAELLDAIELEDGRAALVSRWIDGARLEDRLAEGRVGWGQLAPILRDAARGLGSIHGAKLVHRDIKPANMVLPSSGSPRVVLLDFGHCLAPDEHRLTTTGLVLGSAAYLAPEYATHGIVDERADLYALGVVAYRGLTGMLPFEGDTVAEVMQQHRTEPLVPPRRCAGGETIPSAAEDLCLWLLQKDPRHRVPSARVLEVALDSAMAGSAWTALEAAR